MHTKPDAEWWGAYLAWFWIGCLSGLTPGEATVFAILHMDED